MTIASSSSTSAAPGARRPGPRTSRRPVWPRTPQRCSSTSMRPTRSCSVIPTAVAWHSCWRSITPASYHVSFSPPRAARRQGRSPACRWPCAWSWSRRATRDTCEESTLDTGFTATYRASNPDDVAALHEGASSPTCRRCRRIPRPRIGTQRIRYPRAAQVAALSDPRHDRRRRGPQRQQRRHASGLRQAARASISPMPASSCSRARATTTISPPPRRRTGSYATSWRPDASIQNENSSPMHRVGAGLGRVVPGSHGVHVTLTDGRGRLRIGQNVKDALGAAASPR